MAKVEVPYIESKSFGQLASGWVERMFNEVADPRVGDWPMMNSPVWPLALVGAYLYFVLHLGPRVMKNRPAYSLKGFISLYNLYQVAANSLVFYTILTSGWTTSYTMGCQHVDRSKSPEALRMASAMWWWFMMKSVDLLETVIFVLRKRDRQISFLHMFHHVSTYLFSWVGCKLYPGGGATFSVLFNSFLHVPLHAYYQLNTVSSPKTEKKLELFKKYLTIIRLVQLAMIVLHASQAFAPSCTAVSKTFATSFEINILIVICLYLNHYRKSFVEKTPKRKHED